MRNQTFGSIRKLMSGSLLLFFTLQFISAPLLAQSRKVEGNVSDTKGMPLEAVTVTVKGTQTATMTDNKGQYSIMAEPGAILTFSSTGFNSKEEKASGATLNVSLSENPVALESVVVIGYGTQKKVNLSGAVGQISGKELVDRPVPNVTGALQGMMPGLTVVRGSGQPGDEGYGVRIRGFTSANNASALVLVDGVEQDMNLLDPNDVESISVLKDASASAIYGIRAAAGVILITTKQGKAGKTKIDFNSYYGVNVTARQPERLDSWDEQILIDEARLNATGQAEFNAEQIEWLKNPNFITRPNPTQDRWEYYGNNNWVKEGMDKVNHMQNYNLSVGGGEKRFNYLLSGGYYKRDGVMRYGPDDNARYNLKLNVNGEINKYLSIKVNTAYIGSFTRENAFGTEQIINRLYRSRARQSLYVPKEDVTGQPYNGDLQINAVDIEKNGGVETRNYETFTGRVNLQLKNLVKGLTFDVVGWRNQNYYNMESNRRSLFWYGRSVNTVRFSVNVPNSLTLVKNRAYQNNLQGYITYNFKVARDHEFTVMQAASFEEYRKDQVETSAQSMITNDFFSLNFADAVTIRSEDLVETWAMGSFFGRFNYSFRNKYLLEASYRYDGSSRLAPQNRWKFFPSFSAAWIIDQESFMQNLDFITHLKLRASWGQLGNGSPLGLYPYIPQLRSGITLSGNNYPPLVFNNTRTQYIFQELLASPNVAFETVQMSNIGVDLGFLRNKLAITAEYYVKKNKNMLAELNLPNIIGIDVPSFNIGELKSWGYELDVKWRDRVGKVDYRIGMNISDNQNELTRYDGKNTIGGAGVVNLLEGYPLNSVWGYRTDGYFQTQAEVDAYKAKVQPLFPGTAPGDVRYLDLNGDGKIDKGGGVPENAGDLVYLGTTNARYTYGFDLGLAWKGFDFSVFFQGALKRSFLIAEETLSPILGTADMPWTIHMDRWTPDNPDAFFPRMYQTSAHNFQPSDKWVQNGSYLRLKNLQIGYAIPINKKYIRSMKVYVSGQDLWESTKVLKVFDPEVGNNVSATTYPFYRTVSFGLNVSF